MSVMHLVSCVLQIHGQGNSPSKYAPRTAATGKYFDKQISDKRQLRVAVNQGYQWP